jgi:hypothetical protein
MSEFTAYSFVKAIGWPICGDSYRLLGKFSDIYSALTEEGDSRNFGTLR